MIFFHEKVARTKIPLIVYLYTSMGIKQVERRKVLVEEAVRISTETFTH